MTKDEKTAYWRQQVGGFTSALDAFRLSFQWETASIDPSLDSSRRQGISAPCPPEGGM